MPSPGEQVIGATGDGRQVDQGLAAIINDPRFVTEVLLAEYRTLRDEIVKKMDHRTNMVVCSVTVSSAVLGFGIERQSGPLLLVSPLVSLLLGILILFHNIQISAASTHLRTHIEKPISNHYRDFVGWHKTKHETRHGWKITTISYRLPLLLIAVAPAVVAVPLALSNIDSPALTFPTLAVDMSLFVIYIIQLVKY